MKEGDQLSAWCRRPRLVITSVSDLSAAKTEGGDSERETDNWGGVLRQGGRQGQRAGEAAEK